MASNQAEYQKKLKIPFDYLVSKGEAISWWNIYRKIGLLQMTALSALFVSCIFDVATSLYNISNWQYILQGYVASGKIPKQRLSTFKQNAVSACKVIFVLRIHTFLIELRVVSNADEYGF